MPIADTETSVTRRAPTSRARSAVPTWPSFETEIERSLRLLRQLRLPVSLFALPLHDRPGAEAAAAHALAGLGTVGRLPDGRLGLLYLGPRARGAEGEAQLVKLLYERITRALEEAGRPEAAPAIAAIHGWTDELWSAGLLLAALAAPAGAARPAGGESAIPFLTYRLPRHA